MGAPAAPPSGDTPVGQIGGDLNGVVASLSPMNPFGSFVKVEAEAAPAAIKLKIQEAAARYGLDPALFEALIGTESDFRPDLVSNKGAQGLAQLMPETARSLGVRDPFNPDQNLDGGAKYLAQMMRQFNNNPELALAAYNAGPGAVTRYNGIPPFAETRNYVRKVMARFNAGKWG
ncbi:MAG: lytic transglycosylase domain-containing protein [Armatimonadetes bacterium]|nr:lytic transglycosylase domain-containing protein [Armatimonadota bacterium]